MPISIKNLETEALTSNLADPTDATRQPVATLRAIARQCANRPVIGTLTDDDILAYGEFGVPAR